MTKDDFSQLGSVLHLKAYGGAMYGVVNGWPLTLINSTVNHIQLMVDQKGSGKSAKQLSASLAAWGGKVNTWKGNLLCFSAPSKKKMQGNAQDYVRFCTDAASRFGLRPLDVCPFCGNGNGDTVAPTNKGFRLVHRRCLQAESVRTHRAAESNKENGSYLLGIIGALIGMLVGTIPNLLTIAYMNREYAVLFALIPVCSYFGYKLLRGKMDKFALVISIVMSILGVFLLYFEYVGFMMIHDYGYTLSQVKTVMPDIIRDSDVWHDILTGSLQEFLFTAIGVFIAWRLISGTAAGTAANADAVLSIAQPYAADAADEDGLSDYWNE